MAGVRNRREKFGRDYVRAIASAAGLFVHTYDPDRDGVDLGFRFPGRLNGVVSTAVEARVALWAQDTHLPATAEWHYQGLGEDQFNRLAGDDFTVPRYLILVRVPPDEESYLEFRTDGIILRHLAYYCSLRDESPIERPDPRRYRAVRVPVANVLTTGSLLNLVCSVRVAERSAV